MYRFQVKASTRQGELIAITGSIPELGAWNPQKYVPLHTSGDRYPLWHLELSLSAAHEQEIEQKIEYKYIRVAADGSITNELLTDSKIEWETEGGKNRWVPVEQEYCLASQPTLIVDDGNFGAIPDYPYGYVDHQSLPKGQPLTAATPAIAGLKILVIGSSVAMGCSAWLLNGWANQLGQALRQKYGHHLINRSQLGANVSSTIERFAAVVSPEKPDIVIIALSLGNEGLAHCRPHDRRAVQRRFESGLLQLIQMTRDLGAVPMIAGLYPHGDYSPEHSWLLRDTHSRMQQWNVPLLDWLDTLDNGAGQWQQGLSLDAAHPNSLGHQKMFEAIALDRFAPEQVKQKQNQPILHQGGDQVVFKDKYGFEILVDHQAQTLRIINQSSNVYTITPTWQELQTALKLKSKLASGTYLAKNNDLGLLPLLCIDSTGEISNYATIPVGADLQYCSALRFFAPQVAQILYYDGNIGVLKEGDRTIRIINESDEQYNIHPMWKEMRAALAAMPAGVYHDPVAPDAPFRTMMIGDRGLESRIKAPAKSTMILEYKCQLSEVSRIAILPLGDRCAARMLLYKMEYDGPAFPFDLARSTNLGDVADMVANDFHDMWNPAYLHYNSTERRIYHSKWSGLSFGHEVEDHEDPINNMQPILERMRSRYSARAKRFLYTIDHADQILFVRTGVTNRGYVIDLMDKLKAKCKGKPFQVLLISQQDSTEFVNIPQLIHYNLHFSPDWMYDSQDYWWECTHKMKEILESLGISSQNLFWCPPNP